MRYRKDSLERRFLDGAADAHALVARWVAQILTLPRFRILRPEWSDIHQEVLRRVVESLRQGRFRHGLDLRVYVQAISRYTAREAALRRLRQGGSSLPDEVAVTSHTEDRVLERQKVRFVLDRLPPLCREVFRMLFYDQLRYEEISARLGVPVGTVKSRAHRCLERARNLLLGRAQESQVEAEDPLLDGGTEER